MDLALALHRPLVEIMQLPSWEIAAWHAFQRVEPFGEKRADWRSAQGAAAVASGVDMLTGVLKVAFSLTGRELEPREIADFLLKWVSKDAKKQDAQPTEAQIGALKAAEAMRKAVEG